MVLLLIKEGVADPHKAVEGVSFHPGHELSEIEIMQFVEENYEILSAACGQIVEDTTVVEIPQTTH